MNGQDSSAPSEDRSSQRILGTGPRRSIAWTPEQDAVLGQLSDVKAARKLGLKLSMARARRERLLIPPAYQSGQDYPRILSARVAFLEPWMPDQDTHDPLSFTLS